SDEHIKSPAEWRPLEGSLEAIARLTQDGYRIVIATNQSGIARGFFDTATLVAIHDTMNRAVAQAGGRIDAVFFCPHAQDSNCRPERRCSTTSPPSPRTSPHEAPALEPVRARADHRHPALRRARSGHLPAAAPAALPAHLRLVAPGRAAGARHPGHPLARRGARASARSAGGDPRQAPVSLGNDGLPAAFSAASAGAQARAAVDPVLRLGARADEPDRDRP